MITDEGKKIMLILILINIFIENIDKVVYM